MLGIIGMRRHVEAAGIAASPTRAHFTGQQADQPQFGPLAGAGRPDPLLPGTLEDWRNCIHGGKRQEAPQEMTVRCKVLRSGTDVKLGKALGKACGGAVVNNIHPAALSRKAVKRSLSTGEAGRKQAKDDS